MDWDKLVLFRKSRDSATGFIAVKSIDINSFGTGKARAEAAVWKLVNKLENCNERLKRLGLDVTSSEDLVAKAPGSDPTVGTKMPEPEDKTSRKRKREAAGETRKVKKFKKTPPATMAGEVDVETSDPLTGEPAKKKKKNRSKMDVARTEEAEMPSKVKASKSKAKGSKGKVKKRKKNKKHKKRKESKTAEKQSEAEVPLEVEAAESKKKHRKHKRTKTSKGQSETGARKDDTVIAEAEVPAEVEASKLKIKRRKRKKTKKSNPAEKLRSHKEDIVTAEREQVAEMPAEGEVAKSNRKHEKHKKMKENKPAEEQVTPKGDQDAELPAEIEVVESKKKHKKRKRMKESKSVDKQVTTEDAREAELSAEAEACESKRKHKKHNKMKKSKPMEERVTTKSDQEAEVPAEGEAAESYRKQKKHKKTKESKPVEEQGEAGAHKDDLVTVKGKQMTATVNQEYAEASLNPIPANEQSEAGAHKGGQVPAAVNQECAVASSNASLVEEQGETGPHEGDLETAGGEQVHATVNQDCDEASVNKDEDRLDRINLRLGPSEEENMDVEHLTESALVPLSNSEDRGIPLTMMEGYQRAASGKTIEELITKETERSKASAEATKKRMSSKIPVVVCPKLTIEVIHGKADVTSGKSYDNSDNGPVWEEEREKQAPFSSDEEARVIIPTIPTGDEEAVTDKEEMLRNPKMVTNDKGAASNEEEMPKMLTIRTGDKEAVMNEKEVSEMLTIPSNDEEAASNKEEIPRMQTIPTSDEESVTNKIEILRMRKIPTNDKETVASEEEMSRMPTIPTLTPRPTEKTVNRKRRKFKVGDIRDDRRVYFVCAGCEMEKEVPNSNKPNKPLRQQLFDAQILKRHYSQMHRGTKTILTMVDINNSYEECLRRLKEKQKKRIIDKGNRRDTMIRPRRSDKRTSAERKRICHLCGLLKSHTVLMFSHFRKSAKNPCVKAAEQNLLTDDHGVEMEMYHKCKRPVKAIQVEVEKAEPHRASANFTGQGSKEFIDAGPYRASASLTAQVIKEFIRVGVGKRIMVTSASLCDRVAELSTGPSGKHFIGDQMNERLVKGEELTLEDRSILEVLINIRKYLPNVLNYLFGEGPFHVARLVDVAYILSNKEHFDKYRIESRRDDKKTPKDGATIAKECKVIVLLCDTIMDDYWFSNRMTQIAEHIRTTANKLKNIMAKEVVAGKKKPGDEMNERLAKGEELILRSIYTYCSRPRLHEIYTDGRNQFRTRPVRQTVRHQ